MQGVEIEIGPGENARSRMEAAEYGTQAKGDVKYRHAPDLTKSCAVCVHFIAEMGEMDGRCELVAGRIEGKGLCDLFKSRKAGTPPIRPDDAGKGDQAEANPPESTE